MTFYGADTAQLMDLSSRMREKMMALQDIQRTVVHGAMMLQWEGPDADDFRSQAQESVSPQITAVYDGLDVRASELADHAAEQDRASDPRGIWEKINDFLYVPSQVTRFARNVQKLIQDPKKMLDMFRRYPALRDEYRTLAKLEGAFPHLVGDARAAHRAGWWNELTGKGWEKLGGWGTNKLTSLFGINLPGKEWAGKAFSHLDELASAAKANPLLKVGSKTFGKVLPGLDIGLGLNQMLSADSTGYDRFSGGLSTVGGALTLMAPLAGPAAPIVAGVGIGLGVVSAGMDLGKMAYENIPAVKNTVDAVGGAIGEGAKKVGDFFGSIFG